MGCTPAMAAGIAKAPSALADVVALLDPKAAWRKPELVRCEVKNPTALSN